MRTFLRIIAAGAGVAILVSCGPTIRSERDETVPVPQGATWAWEDARGDTAARQTSPASEIVEQRFRRAMEAAMQARGFHQAAQPAEAEFVLSVRFGAPLDGVPVRRRAGGAMVVGVSTGWGYRPWGFGRFGSFGRWGFYEPWGFYQPWGWGFYGAPVWGVAPGYGGGPRLWSDAALVVVLRRRAGGAVAWSGRLGSDAFGSSMTQDRVQQLVDKLFKGLR